MTEAWYTIQIMPHLQKTAVFHLKRQEFESFFPRMVTKTNSHREILATAPLYKGYGYVKFDFDKPGCRWTSINGTRGVIRLLPKWTLYPRPVPEGFVPALIESGPVFMEDLVEIFEEFLPGSEVEVLKGITAGRRGTILEVRTKHLLRITFGNSRHPVDVYKKDVVAV